MECEGWNELHSPSVLGLKGQRWATCTGCQEVEAGEWEFSWGEDQLACQSGRKMVQGKRNYNPKAMGGRTEELLPHNIPCTVCPCLLVYVGSAVRGAG